MVEYSSHDWRKNTDDAVVVDDRGDKVLKANSSKQRRPRRAAADFFCRAAHVDVDDVGA